MVVITVIYDVSAIWDELYALLKLFIHLVHSFLGNLVNLLPQLFYKVIKRKQNVILSRGNFLLPKITKSTQHISFSVIPLKNLIQYVLLLFQHKLIIFTPIPNELCIHYIDKDLAHKN